MTHQSPQPPPPPTEHQPPRRLLAIDPGTRRIGIAVSDELGLFAHPRQALKADGRALREVAALVEREGIVEVVVGLPLTMAGGDSEQTRHARSFAAALRKQLPVPVVEWDERLSSVEATRRVGSKPARTSGRLDSAAAALVLQAVLDSRRGTTP